MRLFFLIATLVLSAGCTTSSDDTEPRHAATAAPTHSKTPTLSKTPEVARGGVADFMLYTHCGISHVTYKDRVYLREGGVLDDGMGNPPDGWDNPAQRGHLHVVGDLATFTDLRGHKETFRLRSSASPTVPPCD